MRRLLGFLMAVMFAGFSPACSGDNAALPTGPSTAPSLASPPTSPIAHTGNPAICANGTVQHIDTNRNGVNDFDLWRCDGTQANGTPGSDGIFDSVHFDLDLDGLWDSPPENHIVCYRGIAVRVTPAGGQGVLVYVAFCNQAVGAPVASQYRVQDVNGDGNTLNEVVTVFDGRPLGPAL